MNIVVLVSALIIFFATSWWSWAEKNRSQPDINKDKVLGEQVTDPSTTTEPTLTTVPISTATIFPTPTATHSNPVNSQIPVELIYPGATVVNSTNLQLSLQTEQSGELVSAWYQNQVKSKYHVTSYIQTTTNGELKTIISIQDQDKFQIEISQTQGTDTTIILTRFSS